MSTDRRLVELEREVRRLRQAQAQRPFKPPKGSGATQRYLLKIIDGNTVFNSGGTTYYGISRSGSALTTVTSLFDPNSVASTPGLFTADTGIGRAQLYINGVLQASMVLVLHDSTSPIPTLLVGGASVRAESTVSLTLASDATQSVTAYKSLFL